MTRTRAEIGRSNSRKGKETERAVVKWLRANGFPGAERAVRTGYDNGHTSSPDPGDITGTPGIVWQVTDRVDIDQDAVLSKRMADTEQQRAAANADYGVLVARRRGGADPGRWWAHWLMDVDGVIVPVRMLLADLVTVLRHYGYGNKPDMAGADETTWDTQRRYTAGADQDDAAEQAAAAEGLA